MLVIELQRELDLSRIVWSIARRADLAEVRARKVRRAGNCDHTVAAKSRSIEVGVVQDVEELRPELQAEALLHLKFLKSGEIQPAEIWSDDLPR